MSKIHGIITTHVDRSTSPASNTIEILRTHILYHETAYKKNTETSSRSAATVIAVDLNIDMLVSVSAIFILSYSIIWNESPLNDKEENGVDSSHQ